MTLMAKLDLSFLISDIAKSNISPKLQLTFRSIQKYLSQKYPSPALHHADPGSLNSEGVVMRAGDLLSHGKESVGNPVEGVPVGGC